MISAAAASAHWLLTLSAFAGLAACTSLTADSPAAEHEVLERFGKGLVVLDCSFLCSHNFIFRQQTIFKQYADGDWKALAVSITQTNFRMDVAYFLLGSAAQGMGNHPAAIRYFQYAGALSTNTTDQVDHCAEIRICHGIDLPRDIYPRILASESALAARLNDTQALTQRTPIPTRLSITPRPEPAANTDHPPWIDPPPAKR
jgi:hypothetical protein